MGMIETEKNNLEKDRATVRSGRQRSTAGLGILKNLNKASKHAEQFKNKQNLSVEHGRGTLEKTSAEPIGKPIEEVFANRYTESLSQSTEHQLSKTSSETVGKPNEELFANSYLETLSESVNDDELGKTSAVSIGKPFEEVFAKTCLKSLSESIEDTLSKTSVETIGKPNEEVFANNSIQSLSELNPGGAPCDRTIDLEEMIEIKKTDAPGSITHAPDCSIDNFVAASLQSASAISKLDRSDDDALKTINSFVDKYTNRIAQPDRRFDNLSESNSRGLVKTPNEPIGKPIKEVFANIYAESLSKSIEDKSGKTSIETVCKPIAERFANSYSGNICKPNSHTLSEPVHDELGKTSAGSIGKPFDEVFANSPNDNLSHSTEHQLGKTSVETVSKLINERFANSYSDNLSQSKSDSLAESVYQSENDLTKSSTVAREQYPASQSKTHSGCSGFRIEWKEGGRATGKAGGYPIILNVIKGFYETGENHTRKIKYRDIFEKLQEISDCYRSETSLRVTIRNLILSGYIELVSQSTGPRGGVELRVIKEPKENVFFSKGTPAAVRSIDLSRFESIDLNSDHLRAIYKNADVDVSNLKRYLDYLYFDVFRKKGGLRDRHNNPVTNPASYFVTSLKNGAYPKPQGYMSETEIEAQNELDRLKRIAREQDEIKTAYFIAGKTPQGSTYDITQDVIDQVFAGVKSEHRTMFFKDGQLRMTYAQTIKALKGDVEKIREAIGLSE